MEKHAKNRKKLCTVCLLRADRLLTKIDIKTLKDTLSGFVNYDPDCLHYPIGICQSCRLRLQRKSHKILNVDLDDYSRCKSPFLKSCPCRPITQKLLKDVRKSNICRKSRSCKCVLCDTDNNKKDLLIF